MMHSTCFFGGSGQQNDPLSFLTSPTPSDSSCSLLTECSNGISNEEVQKLREMQKQKKRECDKRYREKKNKAMVETLNQLAMAITENDNLKCVVKKLQQHILQLTKQLKSMELRGAETIYTEVRQAIKYLRIENEMTMCLLKDPHTTNVISNMIKFLQENEELKRKLEHKDAIIAGLTKNLDRD